MRAHATSTRPYAALLGLLAALFLLRVAGQALVAFAGTPGLPPMGEWDSGLLPYPLLLPAQVVILALLGWVCADLARGDGYWVRPRPRLGRWLQRANHNALYHVIRAGALWLLFATARRLAGGRPC